MAMRGSTAGPPASTSPMRSAGSSLSRAARTQPAVPEPIIRKSNQFVGGEAKRRHQSLKAGRYCFHFSRGESIMAGTNSSARNQSQGERTVMTSNQVKEPVITLSAGPVPAFPRVLRAMSRPVHYDFDPYFQQFYENVTRKAALAMKVKQPALILHCEPA